MNKYLITGANGFVGSALMTRLSDQAVGTVRKESGLPNTKATGDITPDTVWSEYLHGVNVVVHLAGIASKQGSSQDDYNKINHLATLKLAEDAANKGVRRFIFVSTIAVMGQTGSFDEESITNPQNDYAKSKLNAELGLKKLLADSEMELVIIRPPLVYGEGATGNFLILQKLIQKLPILPFGLSNNRRSFISRDNLIDLIVTCATHSKAPGETFLANEGPSISTREFTSAIAKGLGKSPVQFPLPSFVANLLFRIIKRPTMHSQLFEDLEIKSTKLQDMLNWSAPLSLEQNMAKLKRD
ncbi:NAD-dependent epimerase/dehydratase family protein [Vibrio breoganii]|uniref:NAD-dependent epimerase/dehydratase family protein n=1 Tax=Vibrio breoganii TaxID=553239 RepID=UPI000C85DC3A|nr:NAD-dependent epimerase/dehydratase family protein [Vibrio breoganii]